MNSMHRAQPIATIMQEILYYTGEHRDHHCCHCRVTGFLLKCFNYVSVILAIVLVSAKI